MTRRERERKQRPDPSEFSSRAADEVAHGEARDSRQDVPEGEQVQPLDSDALGLYLREIGRHRLLTAEEEVGLAQQIEAGVAAGRRLAAERRLSAAKRRELKRLCRQADAARDTMVRANLRLVVSIARRYLLTPLPLLDLIQEGNLGLMRAVDKFDWRRGFKFSTYATWWIRQAIQRGIADRARSIRLPVHVHELLYRIRRVESELEAQQGHAATIEEIAEEARLSAERVEELRGLASAVISLETPVAAEGETLLRDLVPDEKAARPFDQVLSDVGLEECRKALLTLNERERGILSLRFGLTGEEPHTLEEVGERFGLTRERIRQLEQLALAKLRHPSRSYAFRTDA
jgi:RNA polymerase sigma factor (sigma-70 family)